jgi:hypothetical protein
MILGETTVAFGFIVAIESKSGATNVSTLSVTACHQAFAIASANSNWTATG